MTDNIPNNLKNSSINNGEIDLKIFFKIILRNKILIFIFAIFFLTAYLYALSKKNLGWGVSNCS